jgi:hypothetical protein
MISTPSEKPSLLDGTTPKVNLFIQDNIRLLIEIFK